MKKEVVDVSLRSKDDDFVPRGREGLSQWSGRVAEELKAPPYSSPSITNTVLIPRG